MTYAIFIDDKAVDIAGTEEEARIKAVEVQATARRYFEDDLAAAFAVVGFAPISDLENIVYIKPRESVPDALVPEDFK